MGKCKNLSIYGYISNGDNPHSQTLYTKNAIPSKFILWGMNPIVDKTAYTANTRQLEYVGNGWFVFTSITHTRAYRHTLPPMWWYRIAIVVDTKSGIVYNVVTNANLYYPTGYCSRHAETGNTGESHN
jgi:hypothetical protein